MYYTLSISIQYRYIDGYKTKSTQMYRPTTYRRTKNLSKWIDEPNIVNNTILNYISLLRSVPEY